MPQDHKVQDRKDQEDFQVGQDLKNQEDFQVDQVRKGQKVFQVNQARKDREDFRVDHLLANLEDLEDLGNIAMVMKERMMKVITQLFQASLVAIILYIVKFRKPVFVAMRNNFLVITLMWKLSAKFFTYVPIIKPMTFFVRTEQFSINNTLSVYGGINLIATPRQVCII